MDEWDDDEEALVEFAGGRIRGPHLTFLRWAVGRMMGGTSMVVTAFLMGTERLGSPRARGGSAASRVRISFLSVFR